MTTADVPPDTTLPPPTVEEVSPGIFAYVQPDGTWCLNNPSFLVGRSGVTVIDSCATARRSHDLKSAIERTTPGPVSTLINTHSHLDHVFGNYVFGPGVTIVGHERCREEIVASADTIKERAASLFLAVDWGDITITAPTLTFDAQISLYVDDLRVELIAVAPAHTTNDVVVWVPDRKVLITGDIVFKGGTPFALGGSIVGWLSALERVRALGAETVIPGHGPVCGPEALDDVAAYLRFVQEVARSGFETGAAPLDVAREADLGRFGEWTDPERLVGNLHRAYSELRQEPLGAPIEWDTPFQEMVAYNGGRPLRCLA